MTCLCRAADPDHRTISIAVINAAPSPDIVGLVTLTVERAANRPTGVAGVS